jgi:hypothetical protein
MRPLHHITRTLISTILAVAALYFFSVIPALAEQATRLILKDGSYQLASKYEVHGDRVRYFSAERGEWEELPNSLVDWDATKKYEEGRLKGAPSPEAVQLDKEMEAERKAEEARTPEVAPGLNLPAEGGVYLLDTYQNQPQLDEIQQSGGDLNRNMKSNILRSAINPLASAKQTIEIQGAHAKVQSHTAVPSIYVNIDVDANAARDVAVPKDDASLPPAAERFKIVRAEVKGGKRIAGGVKIAPYGKVKADERFVAATVTPMTGGWVKLTPTEPLPNGEYAIAELLGKEGMNLYVWDFGVNPSAPANGFAWKPDPKATQPKPEQPKDLEQREKQ